MDHEHFLISSSTQITVIFVLTVFVILTPPHKLHLFFQMLKMVYYFASILNATHDFCLYFRNQAFYQSTREGNSLQVLSPSCIISPAKKLTLPKQLIVFVQTSCYHRFDRLVINQSHIYRTHQMQWLFVIHLSGLLEVGPHFLLGSIGAPGPHHLPSLPGFLTSLSNLSDLVFLLKLMTFKNFAGGHAVLDCFINCLATYLKNDFKIDTTAEQYNTAISMGMVRA